MSEGDKVKSEQMLKRTELKTLRNTFYHWKSLKLKYVAANELCDILRMRRYNIQSKTSTNDFVILHIFSCDTCQCMKRQPYS